MFGIFRLTREYYTHMETSQLMVKACRPANFDLYLALMAFEHWGGLSVQRLLCHETSVYNGHLGGPVTFSPIAERLVMEHPLPDSNYQHPACEASALNQLRHLRGMWKLKYSSWDIWYFMQIYINVFIEWVKLKCGSSTFS